MNLSRKLQNRYRMEPAGSQGVWSLDDYQFVSFIWGAAQLKRTAQVSPKSISDCDMAQMLADDYHMFACIKHIFEVKSGPFAEHSNQLWNVSGVPTWDKVNQGLVKMYRAEVLSKFPVMQHFYFGSLFSLKEAENPLPPVTTAASAMRPPPMGVMPPMGTMPPMGSITRAGTMPSMGMMPPAAGPPVARPPASMPAAAAASKPAGSEELEAIMGAFSIPGATKK